MSNKNKAGCFWAEVQTPLLSGAGEGHGVADISLQRDSILGIPKVDGSVWRGAVSEEYSAMPRGTVSFSDLRLLLYPVKSSEGLYTLITCPGCVDRFIREMIWYGHLDQSYENFLRVSGGYVSDGEIKMWEPHHKFMILEDMPYKVSPLATGDWGNPFRNTGLEEKYIEKIGIVSDEDFIHFVWKETERIHRIDVEKNYLFTEEYLPEKSILYGVVNEFTDLCDHTSSSIFSDVLSKKIFGLYMGKNTTLGKGRVCFKRIGA